mmetsp:Transcript_21215/g.59736  ORF Transcript_21215/g.59736 Transcript_21215/m.59736 type:complete len:239 (+) Transcript_21215:418-1134(+)
MRHDRAGRVCGPQDHTALVAAQRHGQVERLGALPALRRGLGQRPERAAQGRRQPLEGVWSNFDLQPRCRAQVLARERPLEPHLGFGGCLLVLQPPLPQGRYLGAGEEGAEGRHRAQRENGARGCEEQHGEAPPAHGGPEHKVREVGPPVLVVHEAHAEPPVRMQAVLLLGDQVMLVHAVYLEHRLAGQGVFCEHGQVVCAPRMPPQAQHPQPPLRPQARRAQLHGLALHRSVSPPVAR